MKYTKELKQEVREYWNIHGAVQTYNNWPDIRPNTIKMWCDDEFAEKTKAADALRWKEKYTNMSPEEKQARMDKIKAYSKDNKNDVFRIPYSQQREILELSKDPQFIEKCKEKFLDIEPYRFEQIAKRCGTHEENRANIDKVYVAQRNKEWQEKNREHIRQYDNERRKKIRAEKKIVKLNTTKSIDEIS